MILFNNMLNNRSFVYNLFMIQQLSCFRNDNFILFLLGFLLCSKFLYELYISFSFSYQVYNNCFLDTHSFSNITLRIILNQVLIYYVYLFFQTELTQWSFFILMFIIDLFRFLDIAILLKTSQFLGVLPTQGYLVGFSFV